jgi:hypothetical protein
VISWIPHKLHGRTCLRIDHASDEHNDVGFKLEIYVAAVVVRSADEVEKETLIQRSTISFHRLNASAADVPSLEEAIRSRIVSATIKLVHQGVADAISRTSA